MASAAIEWKLRISPNLDASVRAYLREEGMNPETEMNRFVEQAVSRHIFETTVAKTREHNIDIAAEELDAMVDESLAWARAQLD